MMLELQHLHREGPCLALCELRTLCQERMRESVKHDVETGEGSNEIKLAFILVAIEV